VWLAYLHRGVEDLAANLGEALLSECQARLDQPDVGALVQRVLHDLLVLLDSDGTRRVNDVAAGLAVVVDRVDGGEEQLLLQVRQLHEIGLGLVGLDAGVLCNDTGTRAGRVEQDAVETTHDLGELECRVVADDGVAHAQTVDVTDQTLGTLLAGIVGEDASSVLHQGSQMRCLTTGRSGHIEHALVLLGRKGHDGEERGRSLQNVVTSEVLGSGTKRHLGVEDLQANLGPLADGLELNTTVDERLRELATMCAEGVGADDNGAGRLVGLEESKGLAGREQTKELVCEELGVAVVGADVLQQLGAVLGPAATRLGQVLEVVEHADGVVESCAQQLDVLCDQVRDLAALLILLVVQHPRPVLGRDVGLQVGFFQFGGGLGVFDGALHIQLPRQTCDVGCRQLLLCVLVLVVRPHGLLAGILFVRVEVVGVDLAVIFRGTAERIESGNIDVGHLVVGEVFIVRLGRRRRSLLRGLRRGLRSLDRLCSALLRSAICGSTLLRHRLSLCLRLSLSLNICPPPLLLHDHGRFVILPLAGDERFVKLPRHGLLLLVVHATHICGLYI
jgi:hypothetical protein